MKKLILGLSILAIAATTTFVACDKKKGTPSTEKFADSKPQNRQVLQSAVLGYLDSGNVYRIINSNQLEQFFKHINFIGSNGQLNQYEVINIYDSLESVTKYYIIANATEGALNISIRFPLVDRGNDQFNLSGGADGCVCKSTGCITWGCNAKEFGPCDCTPCGSDGATCEKTSSRFTLLEIAAAF